MEKVNYSNLKSEKIKFFGLKKGKKLKKPGKLNSLTKKNGTLHGTYFPRTHGSVTGAHHQQPAGTRVYQRRPRKARRLMP